MDDLVCSLWSRLVVPPPPFELRSRPRGLDCGRSMVVMSSSAEWSSTRSRTSRAVCDWASVARLDVRSRSLIACVLSDMVCLRASMWR